MVVYRWDNFFVNESAWLLVFDIVLLTIVHDNPYRY